MIDPELLLAIAFSSLAIVAAMGFVLYLQPVHAALSFAVTVLAGAGLYLLLDAPFPAAATVIVYAGATIIIFLFALMFAQRSKLQTYDQKKANPVASFVGGASLMAVLLFVACSYAHPASVLPAPQADSIAVAADSEAVSIAAPRVADLGRVMYTRYLWTIELAGAILLAATLGAIHIARDKPTHDLQPENSRT